MPIPHFGAIVDYCGSPTQVQILRLKSRIYVQALIRRAEVQGAAAFVLRKGAEEAGAVFLKINRLDGLCEVLSPAQRTGTDGNLERAWARPLGVAVPEADASTYFARQIQFDPDIWIVEIEDRAGRAFVDEPIL
ncbi:MAG: hypothetical protein RJB62_2043 [Pseudomonadota bacterium]